MKNILLSLLTLFMVTHTSSCKNENEFLFECSYNYQFTEEDLFFNKRKNFKIAGINNWENIISYGGYDSYADTTCTGCDYYIFKSLTFNFKEGVEDNIESSLDELLKNELLVDSSLIVVNTSNQRVTSKNIPSKTLITVMFIEEYNSKMYQKYYFFNDKKLNQFVAISLLIDADNRENLSQEFCELESMITTFDREGW